MLLILAQVFRLCKARKGILILKYSRGKHDRVWPEGIDQTRRGALLAPGIVRPRVGGQAELPELTVRRRPVAHGGTNNTRIASSQESAAS